MNKNITIIGINYNPEDSATGLYTTQKAEFLASKGYNVSVITGFPYYPQWKISKDYVSKAYLNKEFINGVQVYRSKQYVPQNPTFFNRILCLMSFTFGSIFNLFKVKKPDLVIAIIPFTTSAFLGWLLKIRYKSKLWIHIQDFEFDIAINSGLLGSNKKTLIKSLQWIEKKILSKGDVASTISFDMLKKLKGKVSIKPYYLTNWIDISQFNDLSNTSHTYLNSDKFKILYAGNIGAKQDWNFFFNFLKEAKKLNNIEVIIVGEGAEKGKVLKELDNYDFVKHYNLVPFNQLSLLLSSADLHILFQKNDIIDTVMPSKLLGMMASAKPSLITGNLDSEVANIFKKESVGYFFESGSMNDVIHSIIQLQKDQLLRIQCGENSKNYVVNNFSKKKVLMNFHEQIKHLLD